MGWDADLTLAAMKDLDPVLIGISAIGINPSASSTPKMEAARTVLEKIRAAGIKARTFLYGIHPSALPERTLREEPVDFVCRGECFDTVGQWLSALKGSTSWEKIPGLWYLKEGRVVDNGWGLLIKDLDTMPWVAWDLLPMDKYRAHNWHCFTHLKERSPYGIIYTGLGCPFHCSYCNIHTLYDGKPGIRLRSMEGVLKEIDHLVKTYHIKNFKIIDELFVLKPDRAEAFCDGLSQRGYDLNIWAYARVDTVNERILAKMRRAGITWICYGIEAAGENVREDVTKGQFGVETVRRAIRMTHDAGIHVIGNFMFGLPEDTLDSMKATLTLAQELACEYVNFYVTMAYPGSALYEEAVAQGLPMPGTWAHYAQLSPGLIPLASKHATSAEILKFRDNAFVAYYSDPAYLTMIQEKFGPDVVAHVQEILKHRVPRILLETVADSQGRS
jgi:anaerobic magnesium-protoporphyrin IX monomethyl ester cyclase